MQGKCLTCGKWKSECMVSSCTKAPDSKRDYQAERKFHHSQESSAGRLMSRAALIKENEQLKARAKSLKGIDKQTFAQLHYRIKHYSLPSTASEYKRYMNILDAIQELLK